MHEPRAFTDPQDLACLRRGVILIAAAANRSDDAPVGVHDHFGARPLRRRAVRRHDSDQCHGVAVCERTRQGGQYFARHWLALGFGPQALGAARTPAAREYEYEDEDGSILSLESVYLTHLERLGSRQERLSKDARTARSRELPGIAIDFRP